MGSFLDTFTLFPWSLIWLGCPRSKCKIQSQKSARTHTLQQVLFTSMDCNSNNIQRYYMTTIYWSNFICESRPDQLAPILRREQERSGKIQSSRDFYLTKTYPYRPKQASKYLAEHFLNISVSSLNQSIYYKVNQDHLAHNILFFIIHSYNVDY